MVGVEPVPGEAAAVADLGSERGLLVADYHAGYEAALRYEHGVGIPSRAAARRERLLAVLEETAPDRLVILGDLMHSIGAPGGAERGEIEVLFEHLPAGLSVTLVKGNHDGAIEDWLGDLEGAAVDLEVRDGAGTCVGVVGVCHGHTWPAPAALSGTVLCLGHEHPRVRLEDEVGGTTVEGVWLRGELAPGPFAERPAYGDRPWEPDPPAVIVLPAFNELVGGTWVNVPDQSFLAPFLPAGLTGGELYLLDGTRLGALEAV